MIQINENYLKLQAGYLFPEIGRRVREYTEKNPQAQIIKLGIGDVTLPLCKSLVKAFHEGVDEMAKSESFKGYGPEQGYEFLREAIVNSQFKNLSIQSDEIFISDGSKCDAGNIQEIFSTTAKVAVTDPVYPVYVDTNVMAGRTEEFQDGSYKGLTYLPSTSENGFCPALPETPFDLIYICSPNNPTGTVLTHKELKKWVDYARSNKAIILFDAAYEAFVQDDSLPRSIFEIEGANECAIEFRSLSKNAGFTGVRCAYTIIPKTVKAYDSEENEHSVHKLWSRRHCTKFNGVSYPVQKAAAAAFSEEGQKEIKEYINYYMNNAKIIKSTLKELGLDVYGGDNAPYIWFKTPNNSSSWDFFDKLLNDYEIVGTPGQGFGPSGEGYFRLSAFGDIKNVETAMKRLKDKPFHE